jgi:hypothetical protein
MTPSDAPRPIADDAQYRALSLVQVLSEFTVHSGQFEFLFSGIEKLCRLRRFYFT